MFFYFNDSDEEAGQTGVEHHGDDDADDADVKAETNQRQSLTHRLSSLYETLMSKAAPKKSASGERPAAPANSGALTAPATPVDTETKVNENILKRQRCLVFMVFLQTRHRTEPLCTLSSI